jgi:hypothetical protein
MVHCVLLLPAPALLLTRLLLLGQVPGAPLQRI